jgi:hypothetical protein
MASLGSSLIVCIALVDFFSLQQASAQVSVMLGSGESLQQSSAHESASLDGGGPEQQPSPQLPLSALGSTAPHPLFSFGGGVDEDAHVFAPGEQQDFGGTE